MTTVELTKPKTTKTESTTDELVKFTVDIQTFNQALAQCGRAVPTRPSHPVLANLLFKVASDRVTIIGFDLGLGIQIEIPTAGLLTTNGNVTLPAKLLSDIVGKLPAGELEITVDREFNATLSCSSGRYTLKGMEATEYPDLPVVDGEVVELAIADVQQALSACLYSTSTDETKQVLTGMHWTFKDDTFEFAATDGHRLAAATVQSEADFKEEELTIPGKTLGELAKVLNSSKDESFKLRLDQAIVSIQVGNVTLNSRLLEGQYPNYNQLIPRQFTRQATLERRTLISSLERLAILANQKNDVVEFALNQEAQTLVLSVEAADVGSGREELSAQITGDDLAIAFNVKYVIEALKAMTTTEVSINANTKASPVVINPLGGMTTTALIMPVQAR